MHACCVLNGLSVHGKQDYNNLAASVSEVRRELRDKASALSASAGNAALVARAEAHAQALQELAKRLEE